MSANLVSANGEGVQFIISQSELDKKMSQNLNVNPICEHRLYLRLFVTNGGWL